MWVATGSDYKQVLDEFKQRFNQHERAQKLVKGWNRLIILEATDTESHFGLMIENQRVTEIVENPDYDEEAPNLIQLQAEEIVLQEIFSGVTNPATALVEGSLAVFSGDRDKVKLEALAMVIWRLG